MQNLPTDLLRTFVTVVERGSITAASVAVGRSQPAVTLQIQRLEDRLGVPLLVRQGRTVVPTEEGRVLLRYARDMLALNDEVVARLSRSALEGTVRLGIPNEFASSFLPEILGKFARVHPNVTIEVTCDLSTNLLTCHERGELDVVFALHKDGLDGAEQGWTEELAWVGGPNHVVHTRTPLPLIVAPKGCVYRARILEVLDRQRLSWRIAYTSPSFGGICAGVMAGLGVTVLARSIVPEGFRTLDEEGLPPLNPVQVRLHHSRDGAPPAVSELVDYMAGYLTAR